MSRVREGTRCHLSPEKATQRKLIRQGVIPPPVMKYEDDIDAAWLKAGLPDGPECDGTNW